MRILTDVKMLGVKHFEKLIACAATGLFAVSMIQGIGTMSFNKADKAENSLCSMTFTEFMADANSRNITYEEVIFPSEGMSKTNKRKNDGIIKPSIDKKYQQNIRKEKNILTAVKNENIEKRITDKKAKTVSKSKSKKHSYKKTGNKVKDRLNSVKLKPTKFLKGKNEKILKKHLNKIIDDDMSNYQKAKVCYDYIINNTYYSYGGWGNAVESVLENGYGTCTEYSYVYMAMMKYLGFDAKTVDGSTAMAGGGYGYHMWVEVKLDDEVYAFDPQVEDDMSNGKINYNRFCKTYSEVSGSYIK